MLLHSTLTSSFLCLCTSDLGILTSHCKSCSGYAMICFCFFVFFLRDKLGYQPAFCSVLLSTWNCFLHLLDEIINYICHSTYIAYRWLTCLLKCMCGSLKVMIAMAMHPWNSQMVPTSVGGHNKEENHIRLVAKTLLSQSRLSMLTCLV